MFKIKKVNMNEINHLIVESRRFYVAPMDDMWEEGIIPSCQFYIISIDENDCGFFAMDSEGTLLAFFVRKDFDAEAIFKFVLSEMKIKKVYVASYDPIFFNLCQNFSTDFSDNTFLYTEEEHHKPIAPFEGIQMKMAEKDDLERMLEFSEKKADTAGDWVRPYVSKLIDREGLFLFTLVDQIIGFGETRNSGSDSGTANIGVVVSVDFRRKGLATYIINTMREISNNRGKHTICSTTVDNTSSQKTLLKCGYRCYHKIYTVELQESF